MMARRPHSVVPSRSNTVVLDAHPFEVAVGARVPTTGVLIGSEVAGLPCSLDLHV